MRAVEVPEPGGPEVLRVVERDDPEPEPGAFVVRVAATTVNPTDLGARRGRTRGGVSPPYVLGWDYAGEVTEVGDGVSGFRPGDRVAGMIPWYEMGGVVGAYATHVVVRPEWTSHLPDGIDMVTAATVPLNGLTAIQALDLLDAPEGAEVLVTGVSGAVGGYAAQIAAQSGSRVTAMCSSGDESWARGTGAVHVIVGRDTVPAGRTFFYVFDAVPLGHAVLPSVEDGGRVVWTRRVERDGAKQAEQVDFLVHPDAQALGRLLEMVAEGRLATRIAHVLPLDDAARGHALVEKGGLRGKVVLRP